MNIIMNIIMIIILDAFLPKAHSVSHGFGAQPAQPFPYVEGKQKSRKERKTSCLILVNRLRG